MHNIHTHTWNQRRHMADSFVQEAALSRGYALDLTVDFDAFLADNAACDRVVVFGAKARLTGLWVPDEHVADFAARAPGRLIGFAGCDPTQPECLDELRHAVERLRLAGVKMMPMYAGFDPRDPRCEPVYAYCESRGLPIVFHTGTTFNRAAPLGFSRPWLWDDVAIRHPGLRMVLAHAGHPFGDECLVVIRKHPHVYADISALFYRPWQFYNLLIAAQEYRVTHKLLFGTDYPFARLEESVNGLRNANAVIGASGLPAVAGETIDGILGRDALALLGLK